jgi:glycosyltransferase involved in cell wall biosynthesis
VVSVRRVWVVSPFSSVPPPDSADRYAFICAELVRRGASVTQFVSHFDHHLKRPREPRGPPWRMVEVYEPGYATNVSYRRLLSHAVFDLFLPFAMVGEAIRTGKPDAILAALPHNGGAAGAMLFARAVGAVSILDVHDTWPESLLGVSPVAGARAIPLAVWKGLADFAYRRADHVFAESIRYARRADSARVNRGLSHAVPIYLGGDPGYYRGIPRAGSLPAALNGARFLVVFAGTLGKNYDLDCALEAFERFSSRIPEAGLMLLGAGEREQELRKRIDSLKIRAWVSGRLPHAELVALLKHAHVGLNSFQAGGNVAFSYKLNDYLLAGVPVVNSLPGESEEMLEQNGLGLSYRAGDATSLEAALRVARERWLLDPGWGARVLEFSASALDRSRIYVPLFDACLATGQA